jgi:hypothetical protein
MCGCAIIFFMGNNSLGDARRRQMDMRIRARDGLVRSKGFNPRRNLLEEAKKEIKVFTPTHIPGGHVGVSFQDEDRESYRIYQWIKTRIDKRDKYNKKQEKHPTKQLKQLRKEHKGW